MTRTPDTKGGVAVVGGARGIGRAVAGEAVARGTHVLHLADVLEDEVQHTAGDLRATAPGRVTATAVDVTDEAAVRAMVAGWGDDLPGVVITTAGVREAASTQQTSTQLWERTLAVNLTGTFHVLRAVSDAWIAAGLPGVVVAIASIGGEVGFSDRAAYCASKAGVIGLVRAAALDLAPHAIRVVAVSPGFVRTDMSRDQDVDFVSSVVPLGRRAQAEELAPFVLDLAAAPFVTGTSVVVDGGLLAGYRLT